MRKGIACRNGVRIIYTDKNNSITLRDIWPIALFFDSSRMLAGWCELRQSFHDFRLDRIKELIVSDRLGVSLDIENYCTLRLFFDLSTLAGLSRRNLPEAGIRLLFQL
ncbi:WYL domain-containing protein [Mixta intestinalis]|uniref:WYL domain-containing protein n=1 Tax=Mixta intestinalis TaxID=1615494 RepID=UPI0013701071